MIDYNSIVRLTLKLFGLGLVGYGAVTLSTYLPPLLQSRNWNDQTEAIILSYVVPLLIPFLLGLLLWFFPSVVANTVIRVESIDEKRMAEWSIELERIAVSLLGLFLLYRGLSDIVYHLMARRERMAAGVSLPDDFYALVVSTVVELVIATIFLLQAEKIVALVRKARGR